MSVLLLLVASARTALAGAPDPVVPGASRFGLAVATGVPFLVMSEISLGITDYGAVGIFGGTTPVVSGFGVRPRIAVPLRRAARLLLSAPVVYYPPTERRGAWWLARPSLTVDVVPSEDWHLGAGGGFVAVSTHDALFGTEPPSWPDGSPYGGFSNGARSDAWWTLNVLVSRAVSDRTYVFADATAIFSGAALAGSDWIAGPPTIVFIGVGTEL